MTRGWEHHIYQKKRNLSLYIWPSHWYSRGGNGNGNNFRLTTLHNNSGKPGHQRVTARRDLSLSKRLYVSAVRGKDQSSHNDLWEAAAPKCWDAALNVQNLGQHFVTILSTLNTTTSTCLSMDDVLKATGCFFLLYWSYSFLKGLQVSVRTSGECSSSVLTKPRCKRPLIMPQDIDQCFLQ